MPADAGSGISSAQHPGAIDGRYLVRATACALAVTLLLFAGATEPAAAGARAGAGYDASFSGESAFTAQPAGHSAQLTAIFLNDGTEAWVPGVVGLLVCDADACGVPSANAAYASGWFSATVYATLATTVLPGQSGFFTYQITVPQGMPAGTTATFGGEVGLIETGLPFDPQGYFQSNTTPDLGGTLVASFLTQPLPVDDHSTSILRVDVLDSAGGRVFTDDVTQVTVTRASTDGAVCSIDGGGEATRTVARGRAEFTATAAGDPGVCHVAISVGGGASGTDTVLETRTGGSATRLTVSGSSSPQIVGAGAPIIVAVDIDDVNVALVPSDQTTVVHLALDPASCTGAPGADVYVPSGVDVPAVDGRVWFILRSNGAYPDCHATVTAPALIGSSLVAAFASGPAATVTCAFTPPVVDADGLSMATASAEVRDVFGNAVTGIDPSAVRFVRLSGAATAPLGDATQPLGSSAAFLTVQAATAVGVDVYAAIFGQTAQSDCTITVRSPAH